jgi:DUF4097 and DUF4098 domain-containing protein YvlB
MRLTRFGHFIVAAAVLSLWMPAEAAAQKETETVNRTVPLPSHGTLRLKNFSGNVHLTPASGNDVVIKAVRVARREQLDHIKLEIETTGSTVSIDANKRDADWRDHNDNVVETTFDIQVPAAAVLDVYGFSSDLDIRGITGDQKLETFSGDITVEGAKGAMDLKTFSGRIDLNLTGAGTSPSLSAETFSGRIQVRLADNAKGQLSFDSFSGQFNSDIPLTVRSVGRRQTSGSLPGGADGSTLRFHTFSGDVRVTK